jgi:hypothetical protein
MPSLLDWKKDYVNEARRITVLSLETLLGREEYHANVHHSISTLFNVLGDHESSDDDVSKSAVTLFNHLIVSSYRRFMTMDSQEMLDEPFQKCLVNKAFDIEALPTQRELLYTLTSGASLIHILQTLFVYLDADIEHMKRAGNVDSSQCIQRYARETLCPICISTPSSMSSSVNYDNEPLCEHDCRFVIKTCFDQASNPYVAFAFAAQGYSHVVKQIQEAVVELKVKCHSVLCVSHTNTAKNALAVFPCSLLNDFRSCIFISTIWWSTRPTLGIPTFNCKRLVRTLIVNLSVLFSLYNRSYLNDVNSSPNGTNRCITYWINFNHRSTISTTASQKKSRRTFARTRTMLFNQIAAHKSINIRLGK